MLSSWLPTWLAGETPQTDNQSETLIEANVNVQTNAQTDVQTNAQTDVQHKVEIAIDAPLNTDSSELESPVLIDLPHQVSPVVYQSESPVSKPATPMCSTLPNNAMEEQRVYFQRASPKAEDKTLIPIHTESPEPEITQDLSSKLLNLPISDSPANMTPQSSWIPPSPTVISISPSPSNQSVSPKIASPATSTSSRDPMFYVNYPYAPKNATTTMTFKATPVASASEVLDPIAESSVVDSVVSKHDITPIIEDLIREIETMTAETQTDMQTQTPHLMALGSTYRKYNVSRDNREDDLELVSGCLDAMGLQGLEFCQQMEKYQCLMAGSFPLQCLFGEYYADSDINIFSSSAREYYAFSSWLSHQYDVEGEWKSLKLPFLTMSKTYQINPNTSVNIILVAADNLQEYLKYTSDLSFCQTSFDGVKLNYSDLTLRKVGQIQNLEVPLASIVRRIQKYQSRGYLIIDAQQFIDAYYRIHSGKWE